MPSAFLFTSTTRFFDLRLIRRDFVNSSSLAISSLIFDVNCAVGDMEKR